MANRFLRTRVALANTDEQDQLKDILGKTPNVNDLDSLVYGETVIDLAEVCAVRESYDDNELVPDECVLYIVDSLFYIKSPYADVVAQWIAVKDPDSVTQEVTPIDLGAAVDRLTTALDQDPELYEGYKENIAMSFRQAINHYMTPSIRQHYVSESHIYHDITQRGAKNFLDLFINSTKPPRP